MLSPRPKWAIHAMHATINELIIVARTFLSMRHLFRSIALVLIVLAPLSVAAETLDLYALTAHIAQLQAQIAAQQNAPQSANQQGSGAHCVAIQRTLSKGDSGDDVIDLQKFLIGEGDLVAGNTTGFFGTLTETAVKDWQGSHGITVLGIVGPKTRIAMACTGAPSTGPMLISNQCPTVPKPANCSNEVSVQQNGCTVGWQCSVVSLPAQTFTASPRTGPTPLVVRFSGVVTSANAGFCAGRFCAATLVFGDGATGAVPLPNAEGAALTYEINHIYTNGGSFVANLYQGSAGSGAPVVANGIAIIPIAPVVTIPLGPTISASPNFGNAPLAVTVSIGNITSTANLSVEFGDGTFGSVQQTGNVYGTSHTYTTGGSYTIKLRRTNGAGDSCASDSCQVLASTGLSVSGSQIANAALAISPSTGLAPLAVSVFTNGASIAYGGGVVLDFGDNSTELVCAPGALCGQKTTSHTYATTGTYSVQLLGLNPGAGTTVLKNATVSALTQQDTALTATPSTGPVPLAVTFSGNGGNQIYANGAIIKYGDNTTEQFCGAAEICGSKTKTHTYTEGSQYGAQLIALNTGGASTTIGSVSISATGGPTKIKITAPTGISHKGESVPLSWKITGTQPTTGSLSFELYTQSGTRMGTILTVTNFQSGNATWKIPSSADKGCTTTQPNGLCGVALVPGLYKIQGYVSGVTPAPEVTSESTIEIKDEVIAPGGFTVSVTPTTAEIGKPMTINYRVSNPPTGGGVALWLVKPTGESVGLIASRLEADTEQSTYPWHAGQVTTSAVNAPGQYHIFGKVYAPISGDLLSSTVTTHAAATSTVFTIKAVGTASSCVVLSNNLSPGDTDETKDGEVSKLQQFLAQDSDVYPEATVNGSYGNQTRRAVERFQAAKGIRSSGSPETNGYGAVGPSTRAAIANSCNEAGNTKLTAAPSTGRAPLSVKFTIKLSDTSQPYSVDFGDGTVVSITTNSTNEIAHTYLSTGTYIAKLLTTGPSATTVGTATVRVTNTTIAATTCAAITHTLNPDDTDATTGGDVTRLQQFLAADPILYPDGTVSGYYGGKTETAVKKFQASKGIRQSGNVGPQTLAALRCVTDGPQGGVFSATPKTGATPLAVKFTTDRVVTTGSYRVEFGDGESQWLSASSTTHTYAANGTFTASLIQSIGNCFGLNGDSLRICEIGNTEVLGTVIITAGTGTGGTGITSAATYYKFMYSCILERQGSDAEIAAWVAQHSTIYQSYQAFFNSAEYLGKSTSNTKFADQMYKCILQRDTDDAGRSYWNGRLTGGTTRTETLASFLITPEYLLNRVGPLVTATGLAAGGPPAVTTPPVVVVTPPVSTAVTGQVDCINYSDMPVMARVTLSNGATRDFEFGGEKPGVRQTKYSDFATAPSSIAGYLTTVAYFGYGGGDRWQIAAGARESGRTSGSISVAAPMSTQILALGDRMSCTVTWH